MSKNYLKSGKKTWSVLISLIIMVVLILFLLKDITLQNVRDFFYLLNFKFLILASPFYIATYFLRTHRFYHLLDRKIRYGELLGIVSVHNLFLNLLPARLGELSYLRMVHKRGVNPIRNVKSLLFVRITDLLIIALFFAFFINFSPFSSNSYILPLSVFVVALLVLFLLKPDLFLNLGKSVNSKILGNSFAKDKVENFITLLQNEIKVLTINEFFVLLLTSASIWLCGFVFNYLLLIGLGINISFIQVMIAVSILLFYSMLPIYTPGGIGVTEGIWAGSLVLYGISKDLAILAGFYIHFTQLFLTLFLGLVGYFLIRNID